jgi:hypothetical protein
MHDVLPYLEQGPLFSRFENFMRTNASALGFPDMHTVIPSLMCPSDGISPKLHTFWGGFGTPTQGFSGNIIACAGNGFFNQGGVVNSANLNGIFFAQSKVRIADITGKDGTSTTAMLSELILSPDVVDHDIRGRYHNPAHGGVLFSTRLTPNNLVPDQFNWCSSRPVPRAPCIWTGTNMFVSARSWHPGGVNVCMADHSVRFVNDSIDPVLYRALGSRNGNEVVGDF